jgi:preprotein translocase subunit SecA
MLRMGIEEGEVIQHSMITRSIERAQRKVEENNYGIRKRLLEYDDVMNSQRTVVYTKRRNALYGERLEVDLSNTFYDTVEDIVSEYKETANYEGFQLEIIRVFSLDAEIEHKEFTETSIAKLTDRVFAKVSEFYARKKESIAAQALPVLQQVYQERGDMIENIIVPFSDGIRGLQVTANLKKAVETDGREVFRVFEKTVVLALIDDSWKEHLREMDELKQSVQNAVYEQKDPLVIYKMEAFNLFKQMLISVNKDVVSFLYKGGIPMQESEDVREARPQPKQDLSNLKVSKPELAAVANDPSGMPGMEDTREPQKQMPVRAEQKIGRNDPCPCGSGKKYKNCHGAGLE